MATLIASYGEGIGEFFEYISSGFFIRCGNSFQGNGYTLDSVKFYLLKSGSPTGTITANIYAHTGSFGTTGTGTGSLLSTSDTIDVSTLTTTNTQYTFTFSAANRITLTNGTYYVVVVTYTGGDTSNYVRISESDNATRYGNTAYYNSSWGAYSGFSINFEIYGEPSSSIKTINGLAKASVKTVNGLAIASIKTFNGLA